jgi:hypothetical protein
MVQPSLLEHCLCLSHKRCIFEFDPVVISLGRQAKPRASLLQGSFRLFHANPEINGLELSNLLPFSHAASNVYPKLVQPAGNFEAQGCQFFCRKVTRGSHSASERPLLGGRKVHFLD